MIGKNTFSPSLERPPYPADFRDFYIKKLDERFFGDISSDMTAAFLFLKRVPRRNFEIGEAGQNHGQIFKGVFEAG